MTNAELRREIAKPGKIYGDIHGSDDCLRVALEKRDLLSMIDDDDDPSMFRVETDDAGCRYLSSNL